MPVIRIDEETKAALEQHRLRLASDAQSGVGNSMNSTLRHLLELDRVLGEDVESIRSVSRVIGEGPAHLEETPVSWSDDDIAIQTSGRFGQGFKSVAPVGRPESSDAVIQNLLDGLFSGALDRGIDLQLSRDGSGRWISFPDNFMSILLQPRNKALLVTVYGKPESFNDLGHSLQLKADRPPYSRFHVRTKAHLAPALDIIKASRNLRADMIFGAAVEFKPMQEFDVKPLEQTCSLLAVPKGLGKTSLIGQQIRSLRAERCLIITSSKAVAETMGAQLYARFALPFKVLDSTRTVEGTSVLPKRPGQFLFIATHSVFNRLLSTGGWDRFLPPREGPLWDLVALDEIRRLISDVSWWQQENPVRVPTFTKHMVVLTLPNLFGNKEELDAISDLFYQRSALPKAALIWTPEERSVRSEEFKVLAMGNPESGNIGKFTCTPVGLRGPFRERWFDSIMDVKGFLGGNAPDYTVRIVTEGGAILPYSSDSDRRQDQPLASETFGEGVFIRLNEDEVSKWQSKPEVIERSTRIVQSADRRLFLHEGLEPLIARMVLVHTLAHVLIREWARDCGWPVSDFRERLYVGEGMAGVLVYTPGEYHASVDQSPGEVIETRTSKALTNAVWCSNDPSCLEMPTGFDAANLGACHSCAILPQASCEAMNCFLDRGLLVQTHHAVGAGFFPAPIHESEVYGSV